MKNHKMNAITYLGSKQHLLKLFLEGNEKKHLFGFLCILCEIVMHVIYLFVDVATIRWKWRANLEFVEV